jgi:hypothetical protein|tara:strand:+ start:83 stop:556 length:474 start_codon:yes stop_codon:yes gene_type:complete
MWICNNCKEEIEDQFEKCWKCSDAKSGTEKTIKSSDETEKEILEKQQIRQIKRIKEKKNKSININENKYPALEIIAGIYRGFAWIVGTGAIIAIFYGIWLLGDYGTEDLGTIIIVYSIAGGFFSIISLLAISEGINLFVNIANDVRVIKESSNKSAA